MAVSVTIGIGVKVGRSVMIAVGASAIWVLSPHPASASVTRTTNNMKMYDVCLLKIAFSYVAVGRTL
jgi:hypothetical protein